MSLQPEIIANPGTPQGTVQSIADLQRQLASVLAQAGNLAPESVTGDRIVANTITAAEIAAGTITAVQIAASTITAGQIAAGTITAGQIAANTITATQIATNTITANQIAAGTITGGLIAAGTITATNIASGTITGSLIAGGTITGSNLVAGTITSTQISVTQLSAISSNMGTLTAGTITGATIQSSTSNPRVYLDSTGVGAVNAAGVTTFKADAATGKITTLTGIGGGNALINSGFENTVTLFDHWNAAPSGVLDTTVVHPGVSKTSARITTDGVSATSINTDASANRVACGGSEDWVASAWLYWDGTASQSVQTYLRFRNATGTQTNFIVSTTLQPNIWTRVVSAGTGPSDAITVNMYAAWVSAPGPPSGFHLYADDCQLERGLVPTAYSPKADEVLPSTITGGSGGSLAPGTVTGPNIASNTITAANILANTITAAQIAAGVITSVEIASHTITAGDILAGTITATEIAAGTITADRMNVTDLSAITGNIGSITSGTITGATFQTASTDPKVLITGSSNSLAVTDSTGAQIITLTPSTGLNLSTGTSGWNAISWHGGSATGTEFAAAWAVQGAGGGGNLQLEAFQSSGPSGNASSLIIGADPSTNAYNSIVAKATTTTGTVLSSTLLDAAGNMSLSGNSGTYVKHNMFATYGYIDTLVDNAVHCGNWFRSGSGAGWYDQHNSVGVNYNSNFSFSVTGFGANVGFIHSNTGGTDGFYLGTTGTGGFQSSAGTNQTGNPNAFLGCVYGDLPSPFNTVAAPLVGGSTSNFAFKVGGSYAADISSTGTYTSHSSVNGKRFFKTLDAEDVLNRIGKLDIREYEFDSYMEFGVRRVGPMAEDFFEKFRLGSFRPDPLERPLPHHSAMLAPSDVAGVALLGVQGLVARIKNLELEVRDLEHRLFMQEVR